MPIGWVISVVGLALVLACMWMLTGRRIATALTKLDRDNQRAWIESWLPLVLAMPVVGMAAAATQMGDASLAV
ncbi:MAG: hypothetical protein KAS72_01130, partial [Phycisphaerales bacterium]|nr:hypothetical protein [Phycisphaerales bacterium]